MSPNIWACIDLLVQQIPEEYRFSDRQPDQQDGDGRVALVDHEKAKGEDEEQRPFDHVPERKELIGFFAQHKYADERGDNRDGD